MLNGGKSREVAGDGGRASEQIRALICGYAEAVRRRKWLVMLQGYIDDSGSDEQGGHYVLAGYILPAEVWADFADRWAEQLARPPRIAAFKMADAEYRDGAFAHLDEPFRKLKVNELANLISPFSPMGVSCYLRWQDWKRCVSGKVPQDLDNPYTALFYGIIMLTHKWQEHIGGSYEKVDFVFDEQGRHGLNALRWYGSFKEAAEEPYAGMLGATPIFRSDTEMIPLQAADMLAWHVHRNLTCPSEPRPLLATLTKNYTPLPLGEKDLDRYVTVFG